MFIRFVTDKLDYDTGKPVGVFAVAYRLLDDEYDVLRTYEAKEIRATLDWFKENLPIPVKFSRSSRPNREDKGICWFRSSASDCIKNIRYLVHLVSEQNVIVHEHTTSQPGYLIYEDEFQVVAEPFSKTSS